MNQESLAKRIFETTHLTYNTSRPDGKFLLRSGLLSEEYFDKYLFESNPRLLQEVAREMIPLVPPDTEILAGLEMGGIPIATVLSLYKDLPLVMVRKKAKEYGTQKLAEGVDITDKKLLILEDVVTTGGQPIASALQLRERAAQVTHVLCVIERDSIARENLAKHNLQLISLFTADDLRPSSAI